MRKARPNNGFAVSQKLVYSLRPKLLAIIARHILHPSKTNEGNRIHQKASKASFGGRKSFCYAGCRNEARNVVGNGKVTLYDLPDVETNFHEIIPHGRDCLFCLHWYWHTNFFFTPPDKNSR